MEQRPNKSEALFLNLSYNKFYDLYDEIMDNSFWLNDPYYRFSKITNIFSLYSEIILYEPFIDIFKTIEDTRPSMESVVAKQLFKFIRNIIIHFPLFNKWDDVWISHSLVNWQKSGSIDRFIKKYLGTETIKYRFWDSKRKEMTYISISFPKSYDDSKIFINEFLSEKDGVKFSLIMMNKILNTQIDN